MKLYRPCSTMTVKLIDYIQSNPHTVYHMDQFLSRYQNAIFNFIRFTINDYHDSLDLTNKVLLTLSRKVKEIRVKKAFNALAIKVIKGEISNYLKSKKTNKAKLLKQALIWHNDEQISLLETLECNKNQAEEVFNLLMIRDLIENSKDKNFQKIFILKYRDNESIKTIAEQMELTEYQVKKYLQDIQEKVRLYLEEE